MSRSLTRSAVAASALVLGIVLAGCGGSSGGSGAVATQGSNGSQSTPSTGSGGGGNGIESESVEQIATDVRNAVASASSVQMAGTTAEGALKATIGKTAADVTLTEPGKGTVEVKFVGSDYYIKADKAFWAGQVNPSAAAMLGGKWVKVPTTAAATFKSFLNLDSVSKDSFKPNGTVTKGAPTTVAGQQALPLSDADGTMYVALDGKPYPLKVENKKGTDKGTIVFTDWNASVTITPPPAAQVVDLTKLTG